MKKKNTILINGKEVEVDDLSMAALIIIGSSIICEEGDVIGPAAIKQMEYAEDHN